MRVSIISVEMRAIVYSSWLMIVGWLMFDCQRWHKDRIIVLCSLPLLYGILIGNTKVLPFWQLQHYNLTLANYNNINHKHLKLKKNQLYFHIWFKTKQMDYIASQYHVIWVRYFLFRYTYFLLIKRVLWSYLWLVSGLSGRRLSAGNYIYNVLPFLEHNHPN